MRIESLVSLALTVTIATSDAVAQSTPARELDKAGQAAHVLSRLTFGARPGDLQHVMKLGVDRWIEQQLHPSTINDSAAAAALASLKPWTVDSRSLATLVADAGQPEPAMMGMQMNSAAPGRQRAPISFTSPANDFTAGKIIRAQLSERQLEEVMIDFWMNHFSVFSGKMPSVESIVTYERDAIRPRALGRFRDLVGAVAHSPAMLFYLDNQLSRYGGINENYGREILELHTLGVDGGYTQDDVVAVARAFTGWTTNATGSQVGVRGGRTFAEFMFSGQMHDVEPKTVLGHALAAGRGIEDGEEVLDIVSRHPSTAQFIATKLARRFVSDSPPPALIDRAAATFTRTDGDITETLRSIVTSAEFFSRAAFRSKVKSPFEFVVSVRRAVNAPADTSVASARIIAKIGQPTLGRETPEGWPDYGGKWMTGIALFERVSFVQDVTAGRLLHLPTSGWDGWKELSKKDVAKQTDGVIAGILSGFADKATRDVMLATQAPEMVLPGGSPSSARLRELLEIALSSPEFQRR